MSGFDQVVGSLYVVAKQTDISLISSVCDQILAVKISELECNF